MLSLLFFRLAKTFCDRISLEQSFYTPIVSRVPGNGLPWSGKTVKWWRRGESNPVRSGVSSEELEALERGTDVGCTAGCTGACQVVARFTELRSLLNAWPELPESARESILTIVSAFRKSGR